VVMASDVLFNHVDQDIEAFIGLLEAGFGPFLSFRQVLHNVHDPQEGGSQCSLCLVQPFICLLESLVRPFKFLHRFEKLVHANRKLSLLLDDEPHGSFHLLWCQARLHLQSQFHTSTCTIHLL